MAMEINSGTAVGRFISGISQQHWLSLALLALHGTLVLELADPLAWALLLSHFGFFLLWQPLWRGGQKLVAGQAVLIIGAAVLLIAAASWWLMALWMSVLLSLIGGNVPGIKNFRQRLVSLLALPMDTFSTVDLSLRKIQKLSISATLWFQRWDLC